MERPCPSGDDKLSRLACLPMLMLLMLRTQTLLSFLEKSSVGVSLSLFVDFSCRNYVMHMEEAVETLDREWLNKASMYVLPAP